MSVVYEAHFQYSKEKDELSLTRILPETLPGESRDTSPVNLEEIHQIEKMCEDFRWNKSLDLSQEIGKKLFHLLNGNKQTLVRALKEADNYGETLQVYVKSDGPTSNLPFELLYHLDFLIPSRIHLVRRVSDWGCERKLFPGNRPLKILFMASSPEGLSPVLSFEKEEETIYEVTKELPVEIDIEDTGSLAGLGERLTSNKYDVIHLSGHADIDKEGMPFFWMEDEEGLPEKVTPHELCDKLKLNLPRLVFLSGCRTGQTPQRTGEAPQHLAAFSFAHHLVDSHIPAALGWGLPVSDRGASLAARELYFELARGKNLLQAVLSARGKLYEDYQTQRKLYENHQADWSLLRLFSDGTPLSVPLVQKGQKSRPKKRDLQYTFLRNSQVKVLKEGFVGRRRQIQRGLRCLRKDEEKVGLLLHGTGGLGKSCLAGKLSERFKDDHTLIIVHGKLDVITLKEALKDGFIRGKDGKEDKEGLNILKEKGETLGTEGMRKVEEMRGAEAMREVEGMPKKEGMPDKLRRLCSSSFQKRNYLILLDDFEKNFLSDDLDENLVKFKEGRPEILPEAIPILEALLKYLPYSGKMTQLIITSRYTFSLTLGEMDLVKERLEPIGLTSFLGADEKKKIAELDQIVSYSDPEIRKKLIEAGRGNPRLMDDLNTLVGEIKKLEKELEIKEFLSQIKDKEEEFIEDLLLKKILQTQSEEFQTFIRYSAVYRLPTLKKGIGLVSGKLKDWESHISRASRLSLMEEDTTHKDYIYYWVTPLLGKDIFEELEKKEKKKCHRAALSYYQEILSKAPAYPPIIAKEIIEHALKAKMNKMNEVAIEEGGKLLAYLRSSLAYKEALSEGEYILSQIPEPKRDENSSKFLFELGWLYYDIGEAKKAIEYFEEALSIVREVYGDKHPSVATTLNNLGEAWRILGEAKKAIEYYEEALSIDRQVYGDKHPSVATRLNNLGLAWQDLGDARKAIGYFEEALSIDRQVYGDKHPSVATRLNNLGGAWQALGDAKKAIAYYEEALSIDRQVYGDKHPSVATRLNNLGSAWYALGETRKAIEYFEKALSIDRGVYGDKHPDVAMDLNNLGSAWYALGETRKAIEYCKKAYEIFREFYGDEHPRTKMAKEWLDKLKKF